VEGGKAKLGDCAVMYRTNAQSRALEEAFMRYGIAYKLVAGTRFYERREVKDIIAYLRVIQNPNDSVSLLRIINVPGRGIGQQSQSQLASWAKSQGVSQYEALKLIAEAKDDEESQPPFNSRLVRVLSGFVEMMEEFIARSRESNLVALFDLVVKKIGYEEYLMSGENGEERWENVLELRTVARDYRHLEPGEGLSAFLEGVTLVSDVDGLDETVDAATLVTLHQAKGLEFPVVFIVGVEEGILPHYKSLDDPGQMEEERRLCYVGITRAKQRVYLVHAFRRSLMGSSMVSTASRFLDDIPKNLVASSGLWEREESQVAPSLYPRGKARRAPAPSSDVPELKAGDRVHHAQFGDGVVVNCRPLKDDTEVMVAFKRGVGVKRLLLSFANLEKRK